MISGNPVIAEEVCLELDDELLEPLDRKQRLVPVPRIVPERGRARSLLDHLEKQLETRASDATGPSRQGLEVVDDELRLAAMAVDRFDLLERRIKAKRAVPR